MNRAALPSLLLFALAGVVPASAALDYERDIMPIFEKKCYECHSAEAKKVKGGLRLDDPANFFKRFGKNNVVVPGDWDASYLFVTVTRPPQDKEAMPPKDKGEALTQEEILKVANWIYEGARIDGEKGKKGHKDDKPDDVLVFKDGRMVTESFDTAPEKKAVPLREWTNRAGKKTMAIFKGLEGKHAVLVLDDGRTFRYPLEKLSDESRALVETLTSKNGAAGEEE